MSLNSEIRKREAALRETLRENSQLAVAVANLTSGVSITDPSLPDNPIIFANPGFYAVTGYSAEEVIGHTGVVARMVVAGQSVYHSMYEKETEGAIPHPQLGPV